MLLTEVLDEIFAERDLEKDTREQYARSLRKFSEFLGKVDSLTSDDLTIPNINRWISHLQETGLSGTTARNYRVCITIIWNYLAELNKIPSYDTKRLRKPNMDRNPVFAWSINEFATLVDVCPHVHGKLKIGINACDFMMAWLWVGFDTALRPSDLRRLKFDAIDLNNGTVSIMQHKTRNPHLAVIGQETIDAIRKIIEPKRDLVFPLNKFGVRRYELKLFKEAEKKGFSRRYGQGIGTLRKTHATEIYVKEGDAAAAESLGHVGGTRTVWRSYIDHRAKRTGRLPPRPSKLAGRSNEERA